MSFRMHRVRLVRRLALPAAAALALAAPGAAMAACDGADAAPADPAAAPATLCLINAERTAQGLAPLAASPALASAAAGFAADMVRRSFFDHVSPDGGTLVQRLRAAVWLPASGSWSAGEDLAWGSGTLGTPARIVAAWMASPGHRANILNPAFTQIGIGIAAGAPKPGVQATAGTYVADFGAQTPALPASASTADVAAVKTAIAAARRSGRARSRRHAARRAHSARAAAHR